MANTQTTVPLFVANTVLTAASQNISAGTGIPVFATTVTRDAAFGGANKALAEGQLCYIEDSNIVQYYDGAAFQSLNNAVTTATGATNATGTSSSATSYTTFGTSVAVTVTTGTTALVWVSALMSNTNAADSAYISFAVSGATTTAASDARAAIQCNPANSNAIVTQVIPVIGLTAGSNTFTCRHRVSASTGYFQNPTIVVLAT